MRDQGTWPLWGHTGLRDTGRDGVLGWFWVLLERLLAYYPLVPLHSEGMGLGKTIFGEKS